MTPTVMKLGYNMVDCPTSWQNFIHQIQRPPPDDVPLQVIQHELSKFGARYIISHDRAPDYVKFESEEQLTWFTLKWA